MADVVGEIAAKLGLQTGEFKAALADANASVKAFGEGGSHEVSGLTEAVHETHHAFRLFHQFLVGGGIVEAVKKFYELAIEYAEKHKDANEEDLQSLENIKTGLERAKDSIGEAALKAVGFVDHLVSGFEYIAVGVKSAFAGEGFVAGVRNFQAIEDSEENINRLLEKTKKTKEEIAKIDEQIEKLEAEKSQHEFEALDAAERKRIIEEQLFQQYLILKTTIEGSLAHENARLAILKLEKLEVKAEGDLRKDNAETQKEDDREAKEALDAEWAEFVAYMKQKNQEEHDNAEAKKKALEEVIAQTQKETAESLAVAQAWDDGTKNVYHMVEGVMKLNDETGSFIAQWENFSGKFNNTGDVRNLSDTQLQSLIHKLNDEIAKQQQQQMTNPWYDPLYDPMLQSYKLNLNAAQNEVNARSGFDYTLKTLGKQSAEASYDPAEYNRLSGLANSNPDQLGKISATLTTINKTLSGVFYGGG